MALLARNWLSRLTLHPLVAVPVSAALIFVGLGLSLAFLEPQSLALVLFMMSVGFLFLFCGGLLLLRSALSRERTWTCVTLLIVGGLLIIMISDFHGGYLLRRASPEASGQVTQWARFLRSPLPAVILLGAFWLLHTRLPMSGATRQPIGRARASSAPRSSLWEAVILPEATKRELVSAQRLLQDPEAFKRQFGSEVPKGLILYGPPGTGKTLVARTLASSAGYGFVSISPAGIHQMWIGESEKAIERLYDEARERAPCVVFLDEVDAVAAPRSSGNDPTGAGRSTNSTLNQLLQEIDGFEQAEGLVFTVAATNRLDGLDEAFKSRLSFHVEVGLPDEAARLEMFKLYTRGYQERLTYSLERLATYTEGMSGRDIASACQWAAFHAFGAKRLTVGHAAFAHAFERLGYPPPPGPLAMILEAQAWRNERLTDSELLKRAKALFERLLETHFSAQGKMLKAKVGSVKDRLPEGLIGSLSAIADLRRLEDRAAFIEDCCELERELHLLGSEQLTQG